MTQCGVCGSFEVSLNIYKDDVLNFSISRADKNICV